jgi:hypothetical protein
LSKKEQLHYIALITNTALYWHKKRTQTNEKEDPEISPCGYSHLIFNKRAKNIG